MCDHGTAGCTRFSRCELCVCDGIAWLAGAIARRAVLGPSHTSGAIAYAQRILRRDRVDDAVQTDKEPEAMTGGEHSRLERKRATKRKWQDAHGKKRRKGFSQFKRAAA